MKKSIIALAVAAASLAGVAQADNTTLYGSVRMDVNISDAGDDTSVKVGDASSRWGIKGSDDISNGLTAFYRFEWGANIDDGKKSIKVKQDSGEEKEEKVPNYASDGEGLRTRLGFVGLKGGFGSISLGRQWSPYYNIMGYNDLFNSTFYNFYQGVFRLSNSIAYATPDMGGFKAEAALVMNGNTVGTDKLGFGTDETLDAYNVGLSYDNNGIFAGVTYLSTNGAVKDEDTRLGVALGYSNDMFRVGLVAERTDNGADNNPLHLNLAGEYYLSDMDTIRLGVAMQDNDVDGDDSEPMEAALGYEHKLSKRTKVWAEYSYMDMDQKNVDAVNNLYFGLRTDF